MLQPEPGPIHIDVQVGEPGVSVRDRQNVFGGRNDGKSLGARSSHLVDSQHVRIEVGHAAERVPGLDRKKIKSFIVVARAEESNPNPGLSRSAGFRDLKALPSLRSPLME